MLRVLYCPLVWHCKQLAAVCAPVLAPNAPDAAFRGYLNAPPTAVHVVDDAGAWRAPFIYPVVPVSQLEQRYAEDRSRRAPLLWFAVH